MQFRINIIDDEKNLNDLVRTYLEKEGYIVYSFYTYDEALIFDGSSYERLIKLLILKITSLILKGLVI